MIMSLQQNQQLESTFACWKDDWLAVQGFVGGLGLVC